MAKKTAQTQFDPNRMMPIPDLKWFEEEDEKPAVQTPAPEVAALQKRIDDLTSILAKPVATPAVAMPQMRPIRPNLSTDVDMRGLPDPITDPEKYGVEIAKRIDTAAQNRRALEDFDHQQEAAAQGARDQLWQDFQKDHAEYADYDQVEFFATKEAQDLARRGIDVNTYMVTNRDKFFDAVVARIEKAVPRSKQETVEDDENDTSNNRTDGIFGGLETGGKPAGASAAEQQNGTMFSEVRNWQKKTGFYR